MGSLTILKDLMNRVYVSFSVARNYNLIVAYRLRPSPYLSPACFVPRYATRKVL